ncbi:MAG: hypothetical protein ACJ74F_10145 [Mycobacterium sp.]|uniref:hypothetical protein n=1 Tax=Mycobacterium sp. TaxID=1785 RepID=UPI00389A0A1E
MSWTATYGGHGRGVMQRGTAGWFPLDGLSQSNSTFFHSAGDSNDARRHLNAALPKDVVGLEKPTRRNDTYSPANFASSNDVSLPLKLAPSKEVLRARNVAPANAASESKLAPSNETTSALNSTSSKDVFGPLKTAPSNQRCLPLNLDPANHASSNSTPVKSKSLPDQLASAVRARRCDRTRTIVSRTSRSFWRTACRRVSSMLTAGGVADHVVVDTNSLRLLLPESGSYGSRR